MAKKRLDRSILEGGRADYNKFERHYSTKEERAGIRNETAKVRDEEDALDLPPLPKRKPVSKQFTDKLGGVRRWLKKQVGRKWDNVFSEINERFDTRNLAGKHVVNDHMLRDVKGSGIAEGFFFGYNYHPFFVDEQGILRESGPSPWEVKQAERRKERRAKGLANYPSQASLNKWVGQKKIILQGSKVFWAEPAKISTGVCRTPAACPHSHYVSFSKEKKMEYYHLQGYSFRQGAELKGKDKKFWNSLSDEQKNLIVHRRD